MKNNEQFKLSQLLSTQKSLWLIAWLLGFATVVSVLGLVMVAGWFITITAVAGVLGVLFNYFIPSAIIRLFALTRTLARYGDLMVSHHAIFGLLKELRVKFFARWAKLTSQERQMESSSQTMHRLVKDIDILNEFPLRLVSPYVVAILATLMLSVLILMSLPSAWFVVVLLVLTFVVAFFALKQGINLAKQESTLTEQRQSALLDTLPATHQLLIWGRWQDKVGQLVSLDETHHARTQKIHALKRNTSFINQCIIAVVVCLVLGLTHRYFVVDNQVVVFTADNLSRLAHLNPAYVLALVLGLFGLIEIITALTSEPLALGRSVMAKERLNGLVTSHIVSSPKTLLNDNVHTLSLQNVSVKMPSAIIGADNINATLTNDKPTLIIGASGAGKSTLLATLAGEIPLVGGEILVNDVAFDKVDFGSSLGFLGQNVDIFDQTLADNLRLGKPSASDDELWAVLDKVNLADWAKSQPKGLNTPLGEYGMAISGGQGRRVALARLLLAPKSIMLLDEPFAGLDSTTRQKVWTSLTDMQRNGQIGILAIATHQIWQNMGDTCVLKVK